MSSLLGPVTDADLRRWQRKRHVLLGELLDLQDERALPPLSWTVGVHALIGAATGHADEEKRAAFDAWAGALEVDGWEQPYDTGRIHLHAEAKDLWGRGVGVQVLADLWEDHPAE